MTPEPARNTVVFGCYRKVFAGARAVQGRTGQSYGALLRQNTTSNTSVRTYFVPKHFAYDSKRIELSNDV